MTPALLGLGSDHLVTIYEDAFVAIVFVLRPACLSSLAHHLLGDSLTSSTRGQTELTLHQTFAVIVHAAF